MEDNNGSSGPVVQFKWTFPLFRVLSKKSKDIKSRVASVNSEDGNMPDTIQEAVDEEAENEPEVNDNLDSLRNRLDSVSGGLSVGQESVNFEGDVFVPTELEIDEGGEVEFANNSDSGVEIEFDDGSGVTIEAGGSATKEFSESGAFDFSISGVDVEDTCGAIIVGDTEEEPDLPCRTEVNREIFEDEENNTDSETSEMTVDISAADSMSAAADKKEREF